MSKKRDDNANKKGKMQRSKEGREGGREEKEGGLSKIGKRRRRQREGKKKE